MLMPYSCSNLSLIAACLAAGGRCILNNIQVIPEEVVKNTLSLMHSCGFYDYSGKMRVSISLKQCLFRNLTYSGTFAFDVGIPAKSAVSGATLVVIPNVLGMVVYSPPIDDVGNSTKGAAEFLPRFHVCAHGRSALL